MKKIALLSFSLVALASFSTAQAALFDDKEARKKIVELEAKQQTDHGAATSAIADLKKTSAAME